MPTEFDKIMARAERETRRRMRREERQASHTRSVLRIVIIILAVLLLIALVADMRHLTRDSESFRRTGTVHKAGDAADIVRALDAYAAPDAAAPSPRTAVSSGRASWMTPPSWRLLRQDPDSSFEVVLRGPDGVEMAVETYVTNRPTFNSLLEKIREIERSWAGNFHIDVALLGPNRAIKRSVQLYHNRILMFDFATGDIGHHIQFSIPTPLYETYEPVCTRLIAETYLPGQIIPQ
jgi:hypothetical protein